MSHKAGTGSKPGTCPRKWLVRLLKRDHAEEPIQPVVRSCGVVELILLSVGCGPASELDCPKLVDGDRLLRRVCDRPHKLSGLEIKAVDRAGVGVVGNQQGLAQRPEILRSHSESPWLVERFPVGKLFHECA